MSGHHKWSEIRHKAQRVTDHVERVRRSLGADGDHAALDALLAELQQAQEERDAALTRQDTYRDALVRCSEERANMRESRQQAIDALREQNDWLDKQLTGCIEAAEAIAHVTGLATSRALVSDLRDARAALTVYNRAVNL